MSEVQLVLTSYPRLFCLNLNNGKLEINLPLKQVSNVRYLTDACFSFEDSYSRKQYVFRAIQGDVQMWVDTIHSMMHYLKGDVQLHLYTFVFVYYQMNEEPEQYFFADTVCVCSQKE